MIRTNLNRLLVPAACLLLMSAMPTATADSLPCQDLPDYSLDLQRGEARFGRHTCNAIDPHFYDWVGQVSRLAGTAAGAAHSGIDWLSENPCARAPDGGVLDPARCYGDEACELLPDMCARTGPILEPILECRCDYPPAILDLLLDLTGPGGDAAGPILEPILECRCDYPPAGEIALNLIGAGLDAGRGLHSLAISEGESARDDAEDGASLAARLIQQPPRTP